MGVTHADFCLFVCLSVLETPRNACGGIATSEATFPGHPEYTGVATEEAQCRIATSLPWEVTLVIADPVTE